MRRIAALVFVVIALIVSVGVIYTYQEIVSLRVERVTDDVHVIFGRGGNVGVLRTDEGAVIVDTMTFRLQGRRIRELADDLAGPPQAIINTHYHFDHTHGNPAFASGIKVVATERTLAYMDAFDASYWEGGASGTLPNEVFENEHELRVGDKTVRLIRPGRGHTDGDLVALFVEDRVVHMGDLFFNGRYPNIDLEAGGSVREWAATLDRVLELEFDVVIPGHGPVTDRAGLREFQHFIRQLAELGAQAARAGLSLEETQARALLDADAGYEVIAIPFVIRLDREFVIRRAWEEATGDVRRVELH
jgi:glyoxylase-like metal-dependent hydrolase (beta-lactamase superfamily II)